MALKFIAVICFIKCKISAKFSGFVYVQVYQPLMIFQVPDNAIGFYPVPRFRVKNPALHPELCNIHIFLNFTMLVIHPWTI